MNLDLAKIRETAKKATPGPWESTGRGSVIQTKHITRDIWFIPKTMHDLEFIALANPQTVIALLDLIDKLKSCANCKQSYGHEDDCLLDHEGKECKWEIKE